MSLHGDDFVTYSGQSKTEEDIIYILKHVLGIRIVAHFMVPDLKLTIMTIEIDLFPYENSLKLIFNIIIFLLL